MQLQQQQQAFMEKYLPEVQVGSVNAYQLQFIRAQSWDGRRTMPGTFVSDSLIPVH
jgi:hypothetical protein